MSGNESLTENSPKSDASLASHYALRVALQTMKERCISLQQRLTAVEEENLVLRGRYGIDYPVENINSSISGQTEVEILRSQVAELTRQKYQLTEHITLVATENRQLWSRLSQFAKDKFKEKKPTNETGGSQNLIRSKTFTQHSPNPNIRQKYIPTVLDKSLDDLSMEEVSLKVLNNCTESKTEIDNKCDEILNTGNNSLGFGYLNDDPTDGDIGVEAKKCIEGMNDVKRHLIKQQSVLRATLKAFKERKIVFDECPECKKRRKLETADKNLETDPTSLENNSTMTTNPSEQLSPRIKSEENMVNHSKRFDFLEEKRLADEVDKICPMCGNLFRSGVSFDVFEEHVETHFRDDSDSDPSIERNFEFISHTVGNF